MKTFRRKLFIILASMFYKSQRVIFLTAYYIGIQ